MVILLLSLLFFEFVLIFNFFFFSSILILFLFFLSLGGCKHVIALISWLHRRSTEKSRTSIECYWTKPSLSKIGQKFLRVEDIFPSKKCEIPLTSRLSLVDSILLDFHAEGLESCAGSFVHAAEQKSTTIFHLLMDYKKTPLPHSGKSFLEFCNDSISPIDCRTIAQKTSGQAKSKCWFNHRFSRITGSKIFEISRCTTDAGSLVNTILGASKVFETTAMKRGKILEPEVIKEVQKKLKNERGLTSKIEFTGIVVKPSHVIFGASPDGLLPDHIIEIKCPSENQYDKYFTSDKSAPAPKFMAQVQLEMFCCDKKKGLFCVADPKFEKKRDNRVVILNVDFDEDLLKNLINSSQEFWLQSVYPKLYDSV